MILIIIILDHFVFPYHIKQHLFLPVDTYIALFDGLLQGHPKAASSNLKVSPNPNDWGKTNRLLHPSNNTTKISLTNTAMRHSPK